MWCAFHSCDGETANTFYTAHCKQWSDSNGEKYVVFFFARTSLEWNEYYSVEIQISAHFPPPTSSTQNNEKIEIFLKFSKTQFDWFDSIEDFPQNIEMERKNKSLEIRRNSFSHLHDQLATEFLEYFQIMFFNKALCRLAENTEWM